MVDNLPEVYNPRSIGRYLGIAVVQLEVVVVVNPAKYDLVSILVEHFKLLYLVVGTNSKQVLSTLVGI